MFRILDEMSELIYVADMQTYDLLYVSRAGRDLLHLGDDAHGKCYRVICGKDSPCEFCTNASLTENAFCTRERTDPVSGRRFLLKDKRIDWEGRQARVEIAFDMSGQENRLKAVRDALRLQSAVTACAKLLCEADENKEAPGEMLQVAGLYLQAGRVYLFELRGGSLFCTHEWRSARTASGPKLLKSHPASLIDRWFPLFRTENHVFISDVKQLSEKYPEEYLFLKGQGIRSMIAVPLMLDGKLAGYIGADGIPDQARKNAVSFLNSIGYFTASMIRQKRAIEQLETLSYRDPLTGIRNRNAYISDLTKSFQAPVGVVNVDINGMKQINSRSGHAYGDTVLRSTAEAISSIFDDARCYRTGSDEFLAISENVDEETFAGKVQQLKNYYQFHTDYHISLGVKWAETFQNIQNVILEADEAMFEDKKAFYRGRALSGRYRCQTDDILGITNPETLKNLLAADQFKVYYQPQVNIGTKRLVGAEALVRYEDPSGRLYPPDQFIPILEEARLISLVDFFVFERACRRLREWIDAGCAVVPISTNFSRHTLAVRDFAGRLQSICRQYDIPQELVAVEITETVEADNRNLFYSAIEQLKQKDFRISIDDFGVNNANLSLLTDVDFHILKIDRHVVEGIRENQKSKLLVSALVSICHQLEILLVAEGVETEEQLKILREMGCDIAQGYLFGRPVPVQDFYDTFLSEHTETLRGPVTS